VSKKIVPSPIIALLLTYEEQKPLSYNPGVWGYWGKLVVKALRVEEQCLKYAYSQNNISIPPMVLPAGMPVALVRVPAP
jgi:hypothetical protein